LEKFGEFCGLVASYIFRVQQVIVSRKVGLQTTLGTLLFG